MGSCSTKLSEEEKAQQKLSKDIDKWLRDAGRDAIQEVKILLLGPGESGKSTVFKQCKIIQENGGFDEAERKSFREIVVQNIISQMNVLLVNATKLGHALPDDAAHHAQLINANLNASALTPELATAVKALWETSAVQKTYDSRDSKFSLNDSAKYFFDNLDRICGKDYIPSLDDILRARVRSTGIEEAEFDFGDFMFRMFDVGGQRSERRKWIHCFESVTAVLFVISLVGYDQVLREDETQNCMKESLLLFDEIVNSPWFADTAFILFLNKLDLFHDKIAKTPLSNCFPEYSGAPGDEAAALQYIENKFISQKSPEHGGLAEIFCHRTSAIDTNQIKTVMNAVKKKLLTDSLRDAGINIH